ncbi:MAG: DUF2169 domain-containing protein [Pseudomonas sp.]
MELLNATPFAVAFTQGLAADGRESLVVIAKGTFSLPLDGSEAPLASVQRPLVMADEYSGEPGLSALLREMDFSPGKPFCDVLVLGKAYAPGGRPVSQLTAGIRVGRVSKAFTVLGPRQWQPGLIGAGAGVPQAFTEQPIDYAHAFGGSYPVADNPELRDGYAANPCGRGWFPRSAATAQIVGMPMPTTEALNQPVDSPHGDFTPMALGPIARSWPPRIGYAGTYDEAWLADGFPFLPADFDTRYYQAAPADQQTDYLKGGEDVLLLCLTAQERAGFKVPRHHVPVTFFLTAGGHETLEAVIDTLLIDTDAGLVEVTWRISRPLKRGMFDIAEVLVGSKPRGWWRARELGKDYYPSLADVRRADKPVEDAS